MATAISAPAIPPPRLPTLTPIQRRVWFLSAMGVFLDGYDLFIIAAALPLLHVRFGASSWMQGLIASAAVLGAIVGAVLLGRLSDQFGRRNLFVADLAIFAISTVLCSVAWSIASLIAFRFLVGVAVGADYPIAAAYLVEFMPSKVRGRMLVAAFTFQAFGMLAGAIVGIAILLIHPHPGAWRWMLFSGVVPATALVVLRRNLPESEHWTRRATLRDANDPSGSYWSLFSDKYLRRTILATVPWSLMDITLYGVGMFTPTILAAMTFVGLHHTDFRSLDIASSEGTAFLDIFLLVGFALNIWLVESWGRIRLQLLGFTGMTIGLLLLFLSTTQRGAGNLALVLAGFAIFNLMVNAGPNATTYLLPAELFPTRLRGSGHGLAAAAGKVGAAIGIFFLPVLKSAFGLGVTVAVAAAISLLGLIITWVFKIETAGGELDAAPTD
ncbi:MAG: MFS transporter [Candidatus Binataceae bacterium]